jgi:malonyl-CoA O-methyltransferase
MTDKRAIARAFGQAAGSYDEAAGLQRAVVASLIERIEPARLPARPRILDIGCGTGFVGEALAPLVDNAEFVFADIAPAMLERCRAKLGHLPNARFLAMDGEAPALKPGRFDLIASSFASQWFANPAATLKRLDELLKPGGVLAVSTLGEGSFGEWRELTERHGLPSGVPDYPPIALWRGIWPNDASVSEERRRVEFASGHDFLRDLKRIGAHSAQAGHAPAAPGSLRRLLRDTQAGFVATYRVIYIVYRRDR